MNAVNKMFIESGRPDQGDLRNYFVKALNQIIEDGFIKISIQEKGRIWTHPRHVDNNGNLRKYNIAIEGYGYIIRRYDSNFDAKDLLRYVAEFIKFDRVSEAHVKTIALSTFETCECDRCNGIGFIDAFKYYCGGICFKCYGSKYMIVKNVLTV